MSKPNKPAVVDDVSAKAAASEIDAANAVSLSEQFKAATVADWLPFEVIKVLRRMMPLHEKHHDHEAIGLAKDLIARMSR